MGDAVATGGTVEGVLTNERFGQIRAVGVIALSLPAVYVDLPAFMTEERIAAPAI